MNIDEFLAAQRLAATQLLRPAPKLRPGNFTRRVYHEILSENFYAEYDVEEVYDYKFEFEDIAKSQNILSDSEQVTGVTGCADGDSLILGVLDMTVALPPVVQATWTISDLRCIKTITPDPEQARETLRSLMDTDGSYDLRWNYIVSDVFYAAAFTVVFRDDSSDRSYDIKDLERDGAVRRVADAANSGAEFSYHDEGRELRVSNNLALPFAVGGYFLDRSFD